MSTVTQTITAAVGHNVPREHRHLLDAACRTAEDRELRITQHIVRLAGERGLGERDVLSVLEAARSAADLPGAPTRTEGLRQRAETPAPTGISRDQIRRAAEQLQSSIQRAFAETARSLNI